MMRQIQNQLDSNSRGDGPSPKKRARGRPLKSTGQSNIPEERRQQVRKAQEAFRQRKQAAVKSLERRAEVLEDCVEQISQVFLDFSDSMMKAQIVKRDAQLGRSLLSTISKIVELARVAVENSHGSPAPVDEHLDRMEDDAFTRISNRRSKEPSLLAISNTPSSLPLAPHPRNLFGNGWFGFEPFLMTKLSQENLNLKIPPSGFGLKLISNNLRIAYFALLDGTGAYDALAMQMFKYAFLYHTREEILANLRWFLDLGASAQRHLGRAVFGFDSTLSLQHLNTAHTEFKAKILHPLVDAQAMLEADYSHSVTPFLNAFDIEEYLLMKGAFHIDDEVIHIKEVKSLGFGYEIEAHTFSRSSAPGIDAFAFTDLFDDRDIGKWTTTDTSSSSPCMISKTTDSAATVAHNPLAGSTTPKTKTDGKHCDIFSFNALLEDENNKSIMREVHVQGAEEAPREDNQVISLNVPLLIDNLIRNSLCLGTGPGYPRNLVDVAIRSSAMHLFPEPY